MTTTTGDSSATFDNIVHPSEVCTFLVDQLELVHEEAVKESERVTTRNSESIVGKNQTNKDFT